MRLAEEGADIVINGRENDEQARESLEQVRATGRRVCFIAADVGDVEQCHRLVRESIAQMGQLDIWSTMPACSGTRRSSTRRRTIMIRC